jgi:hypothetical protein
LLFDTLWSTVEQYWDALRTDVEIGEIFNFCLVFFVFLIVTRHMAVPVISFFLRVSCKFLLCVGILLGKMLRARRKYRVHRAPLRHCRSIDTALIIRDSVWVSQGVRFVLLMLKGIP